eukprot:m.126612 g.126612  ORF g.126612 m.126612 type:complete len:265 (+) comp9434_c2_seq1:166-960(+)
MSNNTNPPMTGNNQMSMPPSTTTYPTINNNSGVANTGVAYTRFNAPLSSMSQQNQPQLSAISAMQQNAEPLPTTQQHIQPPSTTSLQQQVADMQTKYPVPPQATVDPSTILKKSSIPSQQNRSSGFMDVRFTTEAELQKKKEQEIKQAQEVVSRAKVKDLLAQIDSTQGIDEDASELVMKAAEEFIDHVVTASCKLAKHRNSTTLAAKDVLLHLETSWDIVVPGLILEDVKLKRRTNANTYKDARLQKVHDDIKSSSAKRSKQQ